MRDIDTTIRKLMSERILLLDGAMATMLQAYDLDEQAFRGDGFVDHPVDLSASGL